MPSETDVLNLENFFSREYLTKVFEERISDSNSRGVDGTTVQRFEKCLAEEVELISNRVLSGTYKYSRYKEKLILKSATSLPRQISIPTVRDALALRALCDFLAAKFTDSIPKPPHDYIKKIVDAVEGRDADLSFVRLDIKNFYPSVSHQLLLCKLKQGGLNDGEIALVQSAVETPTGKSGLGMKNPIGIPQGLSISNILASIYFKEFDEKWSESLNYFRYVDDILILAHSENAKATMHQVIKDLSVSLALEAHEPTTDGSAKTTIRTVSQGVSYLGFTISDGPLQVREKSYRKVFEAIVKICTRHKYDKLDERLLWKLNLRVTGCTFNERSVGWAFYFRQMNDMAQLHRLDVFVKQVLKKFGRSELADRVFSFVKSHREIRYNRKETKYIPNFDTYTLADMVETIALLTNENEAGIARKTRKDIEKQFFDLVKKQTEQLEQETIDFATS